MTKTLTRLFDQYTDAESAVRDLEKMGVPHSDISIVANDAAGDHGNKLDGRGAGDATAAAAAHPDAHGDVSRGATTGAALGAAGGLLAGLGLLAIPGLGPIVAAGWLLSTVTGAGIGAAGGAATGGVVGALKNAGHTDEEAHVYSEGVRRGGTLVSARVPDNLASDAVVMFGGNKAVDAATRGTAYRESGWNGFDESAKPFTAGEIATDRSRYANRM